VTLKQKRFKLAIKQGAKTEREAATKAGYSKKSFTVYQNRQKTNKLIDEALPREDEIENDFVKGKRLALNNNDLTNFNRSNENLARIKGMFKDKLETDHKNSQPINIIYANRPQAQIEDTSTLPKPEISEPRAS